MWHLRRRSRGRVDAAVVEREPEEVVEKVLLGLGLPGLGTLHDEVAVGELSGRACSDEMHRDGVKGGGLDPERLGVVDEVAGSAECVSDGLVEAKEGAVAGLEVEGEVAVAAAGGAKGALEAEMFGPQNDRSLRTLL